MCQDDINAAQGELLQPKSDGEESAKDFSEVTDNPKTLLCYCKKAVS